MPLTTLTWHVFLGTHLAGGTRVIRCVSAGKHVCEDITFIFKLKHLRQFRALCLGCLSARPLPSFSIVWCWAFITLMSLFLDTRGERERETSFTFTKLLDYVSRFRHNASFFFWNEAEARFAWFIIILCLNRRAKCGHAKHTIMHVWYHIWCCTVRQPYWMQPKFQILR